MDDFDDNPRGLSPQTLVAVGVIALGVIGLYVVSQGTTGLGLPLFAGVVQVLVAQSVVVLLWLAAAAGWGRAIWRAVGGSRGQWAIAMALGVGAMAMGDWALGHAGMLSATSAYALAGGGWVLLALWAYRRRANWYRQPDRWPTLPWAIVLAVPALALLVGACAMPPGTLWASEYKGYDVLSYHLQLPKEWIADGQITGYAHNAYSYMPNLFEAAFAHFGVWSGSMIAGSYAAQLLHASIAMIAAAAVAQVVIAHTAKPMAGAFAAAVYLALPWTVVTGSMAYNEHFIAALGIAALGIALNRGPAVGFGANWLGERDPAADPDPPSTPLLALRTGAPIGLLVGFAALGKLTAAGMFGLPVGIALMMRRDRAWGPWITRGAAAAVVGAGVLGVWLVRNYMWTGNPTFPMFADTIGSGHWTAEQAARWTAAHSPKVDAGEIFGALWNHGLAHPLYAFVFWPAVCVASVVAIRDARTRRVAVTVAVVLAAQLAFWVVFTHHQSRFLVPLIGPGCIALGLAVGVWRWWPHPVRAFAGVAFIGLLTLVSYGLYFADHGNDAPRMIDGIELRTTADPRFGPLSPAAAINALPPGSRVYAEGWATPYYAFRHVDYQTVWDTSRLGVALERGGVDAARDWIARAGYTHVIIDWGMLSLWTSPDNYGYDPAVTPRRLVDFERAALQPIWKPAGYPDNQRPPIVLYRVRPSR